MKVKYYMRGLGIGIILTTIILSIGSKKEALSDTEIISQARELGMVMNEETGDNLKQILEESLEKENDIINQDEDETNQGEEIEEDIADTTDDSLEQEITGQDTEDQDISDQETEVQDELASDTGLDDTITFTIVRGMSSRQVSELLKQKGLIEDAVDFDNYIKANGKSTIIPYGTFVLPRDASYNEILDAIVG